MFFWDDFKLTGFIEQAILVLFESQDPEKMVRSPDEMDEDFEDEDLEDEDFEELYMDDRDVSRDRVE